MSVRSLSLSGQPATVSRMPTADDAVGVDVDRADHAELGDRAADLRVVDGGEGGLDGVVERGRGG